MTSQNPCPTCAELHDLASKTPVWLQFTAGTWTVSLPFRRRANAARWSISTTQLGDALRDARSAVSR